MQEIEQIIQGVKNQDNRSIAKAISLVENGREETEKLMFSLDRALIEKTMVIGITGAPGAGKSTLTDWLIYLSRQESKRIGVIAIDPTSPISGGAIHGDRVRMMRHALDTEVVIRSMATRGRLGGLCASAGAASRIMASGGCDLVIIETVGVGQSEMDIVRMADVTVMVTAPGLGDDIQALKAGLLEVADILVVNKADRPGVDRLVLELQEVAREKSRKVLTTVASEGKGIKELLEEIRHQYNRKQETGEDVQKRKQSRDKEVMDWCLEMLRPHLKEIINKESNDYYGDPRVRAKNIISSLLKSK